MNTIKINLDNIVESESKAPLYHHYAGQLEPQPARLYLDQTGNAWLDWSGEIGGAIPADQWHHRTLSWGVSPYLSKQACLDLLEDENVLTLLTRIHWGHSVEWDGSNHVGVLTDDAAIAVEELQEYLDDRYSYSAEAQVWDAAEWLRAGGWNSLVDVWPSDEPLDQAVDRLIDEADRDGVVLDGDVRKALLDWLEEVTEDPDSLEGEHLKAYEEEVIS